MRGFRRRPVDDRRHPSAAISPLARLLRQDAHGRRLLLSRHRAVQEKRVAEPQPHQDRRRVAVADRAGELSLPPEDRRGRHRRHRQLEAQAPAGPGHPLPPGAAFRALLPRLRGDLRPTLGVHRRAEPLRDPASARDAGDRPQAGCVRVDARLLRRPHGPADRHLPRARRGQLPRRRRRGGLHGPRPVRAARGAGPDPGLPAPGIPPVLRRFPVPPLGGRPHLQLRARQRGDHPPGGRGGVNGKG